MQTNQPGGYGAATMGRPGVVTAAAIVLIVIGALGTLGGLIGVFGSGLLAGFGGGLELFIILAIVGLVLAILAIVAGIGIFGAKRWAKNLGIWVSVAAILVSVINFFLAQAIFGAFDQSLGVSSGGFLAGGILGIVIAVAVYGFVIWALTSKGEYFTA